MFSFLHRGAALITTPHSPPSHSHSYRTRRTVESAKCEPIDLPTLRKRRAYTLPMPTPVTRQFAAPDGEFLALSPEGQPVIILKLLAGTVLMDMHACVRPKGVE